MAEYLQKFTGYLKDLQQLRSSKASSSVVSTQSSTIKPQDSHNSIATMMSKVQQLASTARKGAESTDTVLQQLREQQKRIKLLEEEKSRLQIENVRLRGKLQKYGQRMKLLSTKVRRKKPRPTEVHMLLCDFRAEMSQQISSLSEATIAVSKKREEQCKQLKVSEDKQAKAASKMGQILKMLRGFKQEILQIRVELRKQDDLLVIDKTELAKVTSRITQIWEDKIEQDNSSYNHTCQFRQGYNQFKNTLTDLLQTSRQSRENYVTWSCSLTRKLRQQFLLFSFFKESVIVREPYSVPQLLAQLRKINTGPIGSRMLYKFDRMNPTSFSKYISERKDILVLIELQNGTVVGVYSERGTSGEMNVEQALLFNFTCNRYYPLKKKANVCSWDKDTFRIGNEELVVNGTTLTSRIGKTEGMFDVGGVKLRDLLGQEERTQQLRQWEVHQLIFD